MKVGSLCSGYGGLDLAVCAHYGAEVAWHSEIDPSACKVLDAHWPDVPNLGDLTVVDWSTVPKVDILTAGYPCQPFSAAGKRKGTGDVRHIWPYVAQAIGVLRPRVVVLENVRGHTSLGGAAVIGDLARLGFVGRWGVVPASAAGGCHGRERMFIVAHAGCSRSRTFARSSRSDEATDGQGDDHEPLGAGEGGGEPRIEDWESIPPDWGVYRRAVQRWERILGRRAPTDALVGRQLNAKLSEWMMGLPEGWVTGILPNRKALAVIGNGVCIQQCALALRLLDA